MIAASVNKEFGVIASDSSEYDSKSGKILFQKIKTFYTDKYLITYMGTPLYFANIKKEKLSMDIMSVTLYLETYLKNERPRVGKILKSEMIPTEEKRPFFCLFLMGIHRGLPTLVQLNSFLDFKPKYLYSDKSLKFASVHHEDGRYNSITKFMEEEMEDLEVTPGRVAEVLSKGIYKTENAGGIINAAGIHSSGTLIPLSGTLLA